MSHAAYSPRGRFEQFVQRGSSSSEGPLEAGMNWNVDAGDVGGRSQGVGG